MPFMIPVNKLRFAILIVTLVAAIWPTRDAAARLPRPMLVASPTPCPPLTICDRAPFDAIYEVTLPTLPAVLPRPHSAPSSFLEGTVRNIFVDNTSTGGVGVWLVVFPADRMARYVRSSRSLVLRINGHDYNCSAEPKPSSGVACPFAIKGRSVTLDVWPVNANGTDWMVTDSITVK